MTTKHKYVCPYIFHSFTKVVSLILPSPWIYIILITKEKSCYDLCNLALLSLVRSANLRKRSKWEKVKNMMFVLCAFSCSFQTCFEFCQIHPIRQNEFWSCNDDLLVQNTDLPLLSALVTEIPIRSIRHGGHRSFAHSTGEFHHKAYFNFETVLLIAPFCSKST